MLLRSVVTLLVAALLAAPAEAVDPGEAAANTSALAAPVQLARAGARRRPGTRRSRSRGAVRGGKVEVPIDVGFGPMALVPSGAALLDQPVHGALTLSLAAVIDQQLIRANQGRIPPAYRDQALRMDEVRIRPWFLALIPDVLVISPALLRTGMYGAIWHPFGVGLPLLKQPLRLALGAQLAFAYLFIHSSALPEPTHFLRPGLNLYLAATLPLTDSLLLSAGWSSDFFIPQPLGQPPWAFWPLEDSLWHLGGPFLKLHVRIPYPVQL